MGGGPDGLVLCDKPSGPTSFDVVGEVRRRLRTRQVGHGGTLDPLASGLLPVLVGEWTKLTPWLMGLDKVYEARVRLGTATDTYDAEGRVTAEADPSRVDEARLREALSGFIGRIRQRPPAYSAIKKNGRPLYELARAGDEVEIEPRDVTVHAIDLLGLELPHVELRVHCGKGTYIRSIAHDLGQALGVFGHLVSLRRTRIGHLRLEESGNPFDATRPLELLPMGHAVAHLPSLALDEDGTRRLRMGQQAVLQALAVPVNLVGAVRLLDPEGDLVAIAEADARRGRLLLARVFAAGKRLERML